MSSVNSLTQRAAEQASALLDRSLSQHSSAISEAETELQNCKDRYEKADANFEQLRTSQAEIRAALRSCDSAELQEAATEADIALEAAGQTRDQASSDLEEAGRQLYQKKNGLSLGCYALLQTIQDMRGRGNIADLALRQAKTVAETTTEANQSISSSKVHAADCAQRLEQAQQTAHKAQQADDHMQKALAANSSEVNQKAAAATANALAKAQKELTEAREASATATAALEQAMEPLKDHHELIATITDLCNAIREEEVSLERDRQRALERAAEQRQDDDPCECSENYRCQHCYQRQNDMATGQAWIDHDDPTR